MFLLVLQDFLNILFLQDTAALIKIKYLPPAIPQLLKSTDGTLPGNPGLQAVTKGASLAFFGFGAER